MFDYLQYEQKIKTFELRQKKNVSISRLQIRYKRW